MTRASNPSKALLLLLAVFLAVPWSLPATTHRTAPSRATANQWAPAPSLTVKLGSWLRSLWGKAGANIDPNGAATVRTTGGAAAGTNIDPDGLPAGDAGANIDPNG